MRLGPYRVRRRPLSAPHDRHDNGREEDNVFYTLIFAGVAVLLVVAVIVQQSRKK